LTQSVAEPVPAAAKNEAFVGLSRFVLVPGQPSRTPLLNTAWVVNEYRAIYWPEQEHDPTHDAVHLSGGSSRSPPNPEPHHFADSKSSKRLATAICTHLQPRLPTQASNGRRDVIYGEHSALPILSSVSCMAPGPSFRQIGLHAWVTCSSSQAFDRRPSPLLVRSLTACT
jgi:hypothetical protein